MRPERPIYPSDHTAEDWILKTDAVPFLILFVIGCMIFWPIL